MIETRLQQITDVVSGRLVNGDPAATVRGVARIDSRDVCPGDLFVAWVGANVDGHDFAAMAAQQGAVAALVERRVDAAIAQIVVGDTVAALTALAADQARRLAPTCTVVGITGSNGKTSTKDLLAQVLEAAGPTISPPGSFNNEIGMPLTVLRADTNTRYLILEMGARGIGHIAHLCSVAQPRIGVALNVGSAHIGEFGDADVIARAKGEIVEALPSDGFAVLNGDDDRTRAMSSRTRAHTMLFGEGAHNDVRAEGVVVGDDACATFELGYQGQSATVRLAFPGIHAVPNALAAATVALSVGLDLTAIAAALTSARPRSRWRMEIATNADRVTVINDAYNANPESVAAALSSAAGIPRGARLWVVLGEMLELGDGSEAAHRTVGYQAAHAGADMLMVVGTDAVEPIAQGALEAGLTSPQVMRVVNAQEAARVAAAHVVPGDVVLIKASRSIGLEVVAEALLPATLSGPVA